MNKLCKGQSMLVQFWYSLSTIIGSYISVCQKFTFVQGLTCVKDIGHDFSIEAEQGVEQARHEGSQVDWVG